MARFLGISVLAAAVALSLAACGGGGGGTTSTADPAPTVTTQTAAVTLVTVTVNDMPGLNGSTITVKAIGTNGADGSADLTASAVWIIAETGNGASGLKVSATGLLLNADATTHVVPVGKTVTVETTATVGRSSKSATPKVVTGACIAGLTPNGAVCKFVGQTVMTSSLSTSFMQFWQVVDGKVVNKFTFDGNVLPVMKACFSSAVIYSRVTCVVLGGKSLVTYDLTVDGKIVEVDKLYHAAEPDYAKAAVQVGIPCDANARASYLLAPDVCVSNDKVRTFVWTLQYVGGNIEIGSLASAANFN